MKLTKTNNNQTLTIKSSGKLFGALFILFTMPFIYTIINGGFGNFDSFESYIPVFIVIVFIIVGVFSLFNSNEIIMDKTTNKVTIKKTSLLPQGNTENEYDLDYIIGARVVKNRSRNTDGRSSTTYGVHIDTKDNVDIPPIVSSSGRKSKEKIKDEINQWLGKQ